VSSSSASLPTGALVIRESKGAPFYEAKWRVPGMGQRKRRIGPAWLVRDESGDWVPRRGRVPDGAFDEKRAIVRMAEIIRSHAERASDEALAAELEAARRPTFRELSAGWLVWHDTLSGATAKTRDDYRYMLAEPGAPWKDGKGAYAGLILEFFGDREAAEITTADIRAFLASLDAAGKKARNINKHRQVLHSIFNFAIKADAYGVVVNPVWATETRKEMPAAALDFYEPEEVEALAATAAAGLHREPPKVRGGQIRVLDEDELVARRAEDAQDAELFRVLAYTGIRIGEAVVLRVGSVDLKHRRLIVERALSGTEEGSTKGWKIRYVPLADPAYQALARVLDRDDFTSRDDYVFVNRLGAA
jgi:integrase